MKWAAILFALFIVLVIVLADAGRLGILASLNQIPFGDKAGHFILYGILALLMNLSLFRAFPLQSPVLITTVTGFLLAILIGLEEVSQRFLSNRSFDLIDLAFSYLGLIFFSWAAVRANRQKTRVSDSSR